MNFEVLDFTKGDVIGNYNADSLSILKEANFSPLLSQILPQIKKELPKTACVKSVVGRSGSTAKLRPQKGSGRSRQGSGFATHFVGGVKAFGPVGVNRLNKVPIASRRLSKIGLLALAIQNDRFIVVNDFDSSIYKTSHFLDCFSKCLKLNLKKEKNNLPNILCVHEDRIPEKVFLGTRNLFYVNNVSVDRLTTLNISQASIVMFTQKALDSFVKKYLDF